MEVVQLLNEIIERDKKVEEAKRHLQAAMELLTGGSVTVGGLKAIAPYKGMQPRQRRAYIEGIVSVLKEADRTLSPAEMTPLLKKKEGYEDVSRVAIERAIWMEMRKGSPRITRTAPGKYGVAREGKRKAS